MIRPLALGNFEDLLVAVAKHPAMLRYLDNWRSSAPAEVIAERVAALKPTLEPREYVALRERMVAGYRAALANYEAGAKKKVKGR